MIPQTANQHVPANEGVTGEGLENERGTRGLNIWKGCKLVGGGTEHTSKTKNWRGQRQIVTL